MAGNRRGRQFALVSHSKVAQELLSLPAPARKALGLDVTLILVIGAIVAVAKVMTDDTDEREWTQRLEDLGPELDEAFGGLESGGVDLDLVTGKVEALTKGLQGRGNGRDFRAFLARLLGSARFESLNRAFSEDVAVVALAVQSGMRAAMPFALALDDCAVFLSPEQLSSAFGGSRVEIPLLKLAASLDAAMDRLVVMVTLSEGGESSGGDPRAVVDDLTEDFADLTQAVQTVLEGKSVAVLSDLSDRLRRKIQGAKDAAINSADGVSQAANSLVEFVDRLFRDAFAEKEVLAWVDRQGDALEGLTYVDDGGRIRPTKRAWALCFFRGGAILSDRDAFADVAASGLCTARSKLQKIKHADEGTEEEKADIWSALKAIEGYLVLSVRVGWAPLNEEQVLDLRVRIGDIDVADVKV